MPTDPGPPASPPTPPTPPDSAFAAGLANAARWVGTFLMFGYSAYMLIVKDNPAGAVSYFGTALMLAGIGEALMQGQRVTHDAVNSKMSRMMELQAQASRAEGVEAERQTTADDATGAAKVAVALLAQAKREADRTLDAARGEAARVLDAARAHAADLLAAPGKGDRPDERPSP